MKRTLTASIVAVLGAAAIGVMTLGPARAAAPRRDFDPYPDLSKKIVPIISVGSNLSVGAAQVVGEDRDVDRCKAVAQFETDYKDVARIKILVPIQSEKIVQHIDRVPGVSVFAVADYTINR